MQSSKPAIPAPAAIVASSSAIWARSSARKTTGGGDAVPSVMNACPTVSDDRVTDVSASLDGSHARLRVSIE